MMSKIWGGNFLLPDGKTEYNPYKGHWMDTGELLGREEWSLAKALKTGKPVVGDIIDIERFDGTSGTIMTLGCTHKGP